VRWDAVASISRGWGWTKIQMSSQFINDLKRLADLPKKIKEYDELLKGHDWGFSSDS
jgi:hypothetical protein